jgi:serine/threonine-protein kinase 11
MSVLTHARFIPDLVGNEGNEPKPIKKVRQYALLETVGYGATSRVFLACNTLSDNPFAAKAISLNGCATEGLALEREIRLLRRLAHPNIIKLHEVLHSKKRRMAYLILEWASFGSLRTLIGPNLHLDAIASIFKQVINGLEYLHTQGIVHQDIKPSNILLFTDGVAKLSDFGIGHSFDSADAVVGTPAYQAPEFFDDDPDAVLDPVKEDIWSLGISLYEATFHQLPYSGETIFEISWNIKNRPLPIPVTAPEPLRELIGKMLEVEPSKRFDLRQVREHPFIRDASDKFALDLTPKFIPKMTASKSMIDIPAVVCEEGYTFSSTKRSFSWPGIDDPSEDGPAE